MSALGVENLVVNRAGLPVIRGASLKVDPGTITVLLGANGAGKTTLLEGIAGVVAPNGGTVRLLPGGGDQAYARLALLRAFEKEPRLLAAVDWIVLRNREERRPAGV